VAEVLLFAGPTLGRAHKLGAARLEGITVLPPIRRGDLPTRLGKSTGAPGTLIIVDGVFHEALAVGHVEIRDALAAGWQVWGLASMGAIRAREMHHLGMRGYGRVFASYCRDGVDFRDDEVTMLHENEPPWRELSEPLVHVRVALADLVAREILDEGAVAALLAELMGMWFGDRTMSLVTERLAAHLGATELDAFVRDFDRHRIKAIDLLDFLAARPDLSGDPPRSPPAR
jgi:hypothetical protein